VVDPDTELFCPACFSELSVPADRLTEEQAASVFHRAGFPCPMLVD
jgi:hypothetical protein